MSNQDDHDAWLAEPGAAVKTADPTTGLVERLRAEIEALRADAERLDWVRENLFAHRWNGVVGKGWRMQWQVAPDFRHTQLKLSDDSGNMAGDFRRAIDAAMNDAP